MSFTTFITLNEGEYINKANLIFQSFIDNIKTSHYNKEDTSLSFNIGKTIKIAKFSDLELVIRENQNSNDVKLGKRRNSGTFAIVVDMKQIPNVIELENKLEHPTIMRPIVKAIEDYLEKKLHDNISSNEESGYMTDYEKRKNFNQREFFEENYQKLIRALKEKYSELKKMLNNFDRQIKNTDNSSRKVTLEMAADKLKSEYIGKSFKDFQNKAMAILDDISPDFKNNLDKDNKKILEDRLKQFYEELQ